MPNIINYCITSQNYEFLNNLNINIIVAGSESKSLNKFPHEWIKDNDGINISKKNENFGTLTSHYWIWKNKLPTLSKNDWVGINHYRRFWVKNNKLENILISNLKENILREVPDKPDYDVLLPKKIIIPRIKFSKFIKKGYKNYISNPLLLFKRDETSIKLHFDLFHGYNLLKDAADLLDKNEKYSFLEYINNNNSFHPLEMFVSKVELIDKLYNSTFNWINKCEKKFSNLELKGYGMIRLYDFLAERYFSYFFEKYAKIKIWPYKLLDEYLK